MKYTKIKAAKVYLNEVFRPALFEVIKGRKYDKKTFTSDLIAGIIVGIVAIPLAIAFGIASGVRPEQGIITAFIGGFLISFLGGSYFQIGGPTGAFIVIIAGIIKQFGESGLIIATVLAGIMLVLMGLFKIGTIIKYIPYPVIVGFTSGIAVVIFSTQTKNLLGITTTPESTVQTIQHAAPIMNDTNILEAGIQASEPVKNTASEFILGWSTLFENIHTTNFWALGVGVLTILLIILIPKFSKKAPSSLIAIIVLTIAVYFLKSRWNISIDTIGSLFPELSGGTPLPKPETPKIDIAAIQHLFQPAFTIAILGAIESLLSAMVADGVTGRKHDSNTELIAQGAANIVVPFFGGIPATGAIARTMTNINNGGKTPVAGIIHAVFLLLIFLFLMPLAAHIPMACLAGVLTIVAYNMSEWRSFKQLLRGPKTDVVVLLTTFFLTVILDLTVAIQFGVLIALVLLLKKVIDTSKISLLQKGLSLTEDLESTDAEVLDVPSNVEVYEINGPLFFGLANKFDEVDSISKSSKPLIRIIRMRRVPFIDSTGIHHLRGLYQRSKKEKITIVLSGVTDEVYATLASSGLVDEIGKENVCNHITLAIKRTKEILSKIGPEKES